MSESKHTPGPWLTAENDPQFVYALNPGGYNQFWFRVYGVHTTTSELEAVARVAKAAPELLDALVDVMFRHVPFSDKSAVAEKARAAIAAATTR